MYHCQSLTEPPKLTLQGLRSLASEPSSWVAEGTCPQLSEDACQTLLTWPPGCKTPTAGCWHPLFNGVLPHSSLFSRDTLISSRGSVTASFFSHRQRALRKPWLRWTALTLLVPCKSTSSQTYRCTWLRLPLDSSCNW